MSYGVIYILYFESDHKTIYVGMTTNITTRISQHKYCTRSDESRYKTKLYNWLRKYSDCEILKHKIIHTAKNREVLMELEIKTISEYKTLGFNLKNSTDGGDGVRRGYRHTDAVREKSKARAIKNRGNMIGSCNPMYGRSGKKNPKSISIYKYSLEGLYLRSYESMSLALKELNKESNHASRIRSSMGEHSCGGNRSAYGFQWRYEKTNNIGIAYQITKLTEDIILCSINDRLNGMSILEISKKYNFPHRRKLTQTLKERMGDSFYNSKTSYNPKNYSHKTGS